MNDGYPVQGPDTGAFLAGTVASAEALAVANIAAPTELGSIAGAVNGEQRRVYQAAAGSDSYTLYRWDSADSAGASSPYRVAGSSGMWRAVGGRYQDGDLSLNGSLSLVAAADAYMRQAQVWRWTSDGTSGGTLRGTIGFDASDNFTVAMSGTQRLRIDSGGRAILGTGSPTAGACFQVSGSTMSGTTERAFYTNLTGSTAATGNLRGFQASLGSTASAYTLGSLTGFYFATVTKGAGSTISEVIGFHATDANVGIGTANAGFHYGDGALSAGTFAFYNSSSRQSYFAGPVTVGSSVAINTWSDTVTTPHVQLIGTGSSSSTFGIARFSANASPATMYFGKSRGAASGTYTIVADNDLLGRVEAQGADGTDLSSACYIEFAVDGTPADGSIPGEITFNTKPAGGSMTNRLAIGSTGIVTVAPTGSSVNSILLLNAGTAGTGTATLRMGTVTREWDQKIAATTYGWSLSYVGTDAPVADILTISRAGATALNVGGGTFILTHSDSGSSGLQFRTSTSDATAKTARIKLSHYTNAEEPVTLFIATSGVSTNTLWIGGASGSENALTSIQFRTAADSITTTGTTRATIDNNGRFMIGADTNARTYADVTPSLQVSDTTANGSAVGIFRHSAGGNACRLVMGSSRGAAGTATILQNSDVVATLMVAGADGVDYATIGAQLHFQIDAAPAADIVPMAWRFYTQNSAGTLARRFNISSGGDVTVDTGNLALSLGNLTVSDGVASVKETDAITNNQTDVLVLDHASSGTPAAGFGTALRLRASSDTTAGQAQGSIITEWTTVTHASRKARMSLGAHDTAFREGLRIEADGAAARIGFLGATAVARATMAAASGTATRTTFDTATVTLPQLAERVKALIDDSRAYGLHG